MKITEHIILGICEGFRINHIHFFYGIVKLIITGNQTEIQLYFLLSEQNPGSICETCYLVPQNLTRVTIFSKFK